MRFLKVYIFDGRKKKLFCLAYFHGVKKKSDFLLIFWFVERNNKMYFRNLAITVHFFSHQTPPSPKLFACLRFPSKVVLFKKKLCICFFFHSRNAVTFFSCKMEMILNGMIVLCILCHFYDECFPPIRNIFIEVFWLKLQLSKSLWTSRFVGCTECIS